MVCSMSDQFLELKLILSSSISSSSQFIVRDSPGEVTTTSSDSSSSDSDFTFPAPASAPTNFSSFNPGASPVVVQDLSATNDISGQSRFLRVRLQFKSFPVDIESL